jgi:hypothetical protein
MITNKPLQLMFARRAYIAELSFAEKMKKKIAIIATSFLLAILGVMAAFHRPTVLSVMTDFHGAEGRAEDMLMDPLILHADLVKDRVIQDIKNSEMDKRRYAIAFLGNERIAEAIPSLLVILETEEEKDYFRADALESIFRIDPTRGLELAKSKVDRKDHLGRVARGLLDGTHTILVRTKMDARMERHN